MQEIKPEGVCCTEVNLINTEKVEEAIKKAARWAFDNPDGENTMAYLECLSDLGLI